MQNKNTKKHFLFDIRLFPMDMARLLCSALVLVLRVKRLTPEGKKYTEKIKGGAIIAANHISFLDPFTVGVTFWYRRFYMLVADVVMSTKLKTILLKGVGAIKITREKTDIEAINKSVDVLKRGFLLAVFPQGAINREDEIDTVKSGAVLMALRAGVPIVPMHIAPKKHWYNRSIVIIGKTINPKEYCTKKMPSTADIQNITNVLAAELNRCKKENL